MKDLTQLQKKKDKKATFLYMCSYFLQLFYL